MAWIKLDDQIARHPKFVVAGPEASWLWVCGQSYCGQYLTDGFIPFAAVDSLGAFAAEQYHLGQLSRRLEDAGLWDRVEDGWQVHDYLDYQPSRAEIEKIRQIRQNSGKLGGRPRKTATTPEPTIQLQPNQNGNQNGNQNAKESKTLDVSYLEADTKPKLEAKITPVPVPDPDPEEEERAHAKSARALSSSSSRARESQLIERKQPRIQNPGGPVPLWDWQFSKFRNALAPKFGDDAYTRTLAWVGAVGDELTAQGQPAPVADPVKWWDARYAQDWTPDPDANFKAAFLALTAKGAAS